MGYEKIAANLSEFDRVVQRLGITVAPDCTIGAQLQLIRDFLHDRETLPEKEWLPKWNPRFDEFYRTQIAVMRITDAVAEFKDHPLGPLRKLLTQILGGSITQDFQPDQAKDYFYELWLGGILSESGFSVELREPDLVIGGNGLSEPLAVACKYPSKPQQIHDHFSKGYSQIRKQGMRGCVAIGLDLMVFKDMAKFMDFRQGDRHPLDVMQQAVNEATTGLVKDRAEKYPAEEPIDGAVFTLSAGGIYGSPAGLTFVTALTLQCDANNPRFSDIGVLADKLPATTP